MHGRRALILISGVSIVGACHDSFLPRDGAPDLDGDVAHDAESDLEEADGDAVGDTDIEVDGGCPEGWVSCGDGCGPDSDGDGVCDALDRCPGADDGRPHQFVNPGFGDDSGWMVTNGALINTTAVGHVDPGEAVLLPDVVCAGGALTQTICVPETFAELGPLVLTVYAREDSCGDPFDWCENALRMGFDGSFNLIDIYPGEYGEPIELCLGEAAYDGAVEVSLGSAFERGECRLDMSGTIHYDHVALVEVPNDVCPSPGTVLNGDFESGLDNWTTWFEPGDGAVNTLYDALTESVVGHLRVPSGSCGSASMEGSLSVPLETTLSSPALQLNLRGAAGQVLEVVLSDAEYVNASVTATAGWSTHRICLPASHQGIVVSVLFYTEYWGTCADAPLREFFLDDLTVVSAPDFCTD